MNPIKRIIIISVCGFLLTQLSAFVINYEIDKYQQHQMERLSELFYNNTKYDVLFLGSSRTHLTVNPKIIDSICGVNSYNAGVEGGNLFEFNMLWEAYLQNHPPPKALVLTLDLHSFDTYDFFNQTIYYSFTKNRIIDSCLNARGHNTKAIRLFPFLKITEYDDETRGFFIRGLMGRNSVPQGDFSYKGYLSNTDNTLSWAGNYNLVSKPVALSENRIALLQNILSICQRKGTKVIFTYAPEYKNILKKMVSNQKEVLEYINGVAVKNQLQYFRDDELSLCNDSSLFANAGHLNRRGADIYSIILATRLKKLL
jgi:hypothetical protein